MSVTNDIAATYRGPRAVIRRFLANGRREDQALIFVLMGGVMLFVSMMPYQSRAAHFDPSVPLQARLYWSAFLCIFLLPFVLYIVAAVSHLVARGAGGAGSFFGARMALFWAFLAASPMWLFTGLLAGFNGPGAGLTIAAVVSFLVFVMIWILCLVESETSQ